MRKEVILCDVCHKEQEENLWILKKIDPSYKGDDTNERDFCSLDCLTQWLVTRGVDMPAQQEPQDKPACKARRFLLVDGDTAELTEGVRWERGHVTLDSHSQHCSGRFHCPGLFSTWENFKTAHDGSGVQWIDQEVAE